MNRRASRSLVLRTASPIGGEGRGEGAKFMGRLLDPMIAHWGREPVARLGAPASASLPASFRNHTATRRQGCRRFQFAVHGKLVSTSGQKARKFESLSSRVD